VVFTDEKVMPSGRIKRSVVFFEPRKAYLKNEQKKEAHASFLTFGFSQAC